MFRITTVILFLFCLVLMSSAQAGIYGTCWNYPKIAAIDEDNNCALSLEDFQAFLLYDFIDLDANEDGVISEDELERLCTKSCEKAALKKRDVDNDQLIDVAEFLEGSEEKFTRLDLDDDGQITKAEFFKNAANIFKR